MNEVTVDLLAILAVLKEVRDHLSLVRFPKAYRHCFLAVAIIAVVLLRLRRLVLLGI